MDLLSLKIGFFYIIYPLLHRRPVPGSWEKTRSCTSYKITEAGDTVIFDLDKGKLSVTAVTPSIFKVLFLRDTDPDYVTFSVVCKETIPVTIEQKNRFVHIKPASDAGISRPGMEVLFDLNTTGISFSFHNRMLHSETQSACFKKKWVSSTKLATEKENYPGFGQKTGPLFKNIRKMKMWNKDDPRISQNSDPLYQSCPFMIGLRNDGFAHGIFFDNSGYSCFRLGRTKASTKAFYAAKEGPLCYYVIGGPTLKDVVRNFTHLTGRYSLPPRWVLGHHHSRWIDNESEEKIMKLASGFRKHKVPCDVLHIDIGHMRGFRCFTWDPETFPRPEEMVQALHTEKFKVVVIADPGIKKDLEYPVYKKGMDEGYFCTDGKGDIYHGDVWPGKCGFVDFSNPGARRWWGSLFEFYTKTGIDGFWNDMNEPSLFFNHERTLPDAIVHKGGDDIPPITHSRLHNSYGLLMAKATAAGIDGLKPGMRRFVFCRSSFAGIQHYASTWTGDNTSNWIHLRLSIPMLLNMGLSGQTMTGPDIGGFWKDTTPELMIRWMQIGAFYPFCRNHTSNNTIPQEVWELGKNVLDITKQYLAIRYMLLPYLYTYLRESCETGIPLMRPLFLEYPSDPCCLDPDICETEFLAGPFFLIAPVLTPGAKSRKVYLPRGDRWVDFRTHQYYEGGKTYDYKTPLEIMPFFVKAGAVVPMAPPGLVTDEMVNKEVIFSVYEATKISGILYIDDGQSLKYKEGEYSLLLCEGTSTPGRIKLQCKRIQGNLHPVLSGHPFITLLIHFSRHVEKMKSVTLDEMPLNEIGDKETGFRLSDNSLKIVVKETAFPFILDIEYF
ncbi:MAG: hypothetical protein JXB88_14815 [Spirochaetales bacterium]|nr:hypothetical protein [Spirochaetales bacterium]